MSDASIPEGSRQNAEPSDRQSDDEAAVLRPVVTPPIDIFDGGKGLVLVADLPGVSGETVDVQVHDSRLSLFGRLETELPTDAVPVHEEFAVADFLRSFILGERIDHDAIGAAMSDGVLTIELPRAEPTQPRSSPIATG